MDDTSRAIGSLEGRMAATVEAVERIESKTDEQSKKLDELLRIQAQQRGERRALHAGGTVIGALAGWFVSWWIGRP